MNPFLEAAIEAARQAGAILMQEFSRPAKISYKGDISLVTQADKRSEEAIVAYLRSHFPKHVVVAEEGTGHEHLAPGAAQAQYSWYVDPLDGTTNFAHGYPCFCVSIGLVEAAKDGSQTEDVLVGAIFDPVHDELFTAARGEGAYLNQKRIHVSSVERLDASLLCTGFPPPKREPNPNLAYYGRFTTLSHGVRRDGAAALDLCYLACGRFDGFWEFGLKRWDMAAGVLLVREAGGMITQMSGQPFRLSGPNILASNGRIHSEMQQIAAEIAERAAKAP